MLNDLELPALLLSVSCQNVDYIMHTKSSGGFVGR